MKDIVTFSLLVVIVACTSVSKINIKENKSCEKALTKLQKLEKDQYFINTNKWEQRSNEIELLDSYINELYPNCLEYNLYKLTKLFNDLPYNDRLISITNDYLIRALQYHPNSAKLNYMAGYFYNAIDSADKAIKYYKKSAMFGYSCNKVDSVLLGIEKGKDVIEHFQLKNDSNYVLEMYRLPSLESALSVNPSNYCLKGDKRLEVYDYFGDAYFKSTRILPDSSFKKITSILKEINFWGLGGYDKGCEGDYEYVGQWHLPSYYFWFGNQEMSNDLLVYGLGTIYERGVGRGLSSITYISELNKPRSSLIMSKLTKLQGVLSILSNNQFIYDTLIARYPKCIKPIEGPVNYLFDKNSRDFIKIGKDNVEPAWRINLDIAIDNIRKKVDYRCSNIVFVINSSIYALCGKTGEVQYVIRNSNEKWKYIKVRNGYNDIILLGEIKDNVIKLSVYDYQFGKFVREVEYDYNSDSLYIIRGKKMNDFYKQNLIKQLKILENCIYIKAFNL